MGKRLRKCEKYHLFLFDFAIDRADNFRFASCATLCGESLMRMRGLTALAVPVLLLVAAPTRADDFPTGTYTATSSEGAVWAVTFWEKGLFTVTRDGRDAVSGRYVVTKDVIQVTDEGGPNAGKGIDKTGSYRWSVKGKKLKLTMVKDSNMGREVMFTASAFEKSS
jgi:hypothetical protein